MTVLEGGRNGPPKEKGLLKEEKGSKKIQRKPPKGVKGKYFGRVPWGSSDLPPLGELAAADVRKNLRNL